MDLQDLNLKKLTQSELSKTNGGGPILAATGVAIAVAGLATAVYAAGMAAAENIGYADGKADCPPPPCT
jgi:hypothetical protein